MWHLQISPGQVLGCDRSESQCICNCTACIDKQANDRRRTTKITEAFIVEDCA